MQLGLLLETVTQVPISGRSLENPAQQPFEIEGRSADEKHLASSVANLCDAPAGRFEISSKAAIFVRFEDVDQMVRHGVALVVGRLGRADVHVPIEGHRVHRDDLGADATRQFDADGRLAGLRSRP